ncbi:hypothetical protein VTK56DRAFT_3688 [Thermocarpiscus australiensis]
MKSFPLPSTFLVVLSYISAAKANFDLYAANEPYQNINLWTIFDTDPDCGTVWSSPVYYPSDDVSGDKTGVRCEGTGCQMYQDPVSIDVVEMHFSNNPLYHWTIYKDRNYDMIGLDGNVYGNCILFPGHTYDCDSERGDRKFRCLTQFTADQIHAAQ